MKQVSLAVKVREKSGKSAAKKLRQQGWIPGIAYGRLKEPVSLEIPEKEFSKLLQGAAGANVIINLSIEAAAGKALNKTALIKEIQQHPLSREVLHVDFREISLTEVIKVNVPIVAKGEAVGVKMDGGVLDHSLWELEVSCLPAQIPDKIEVDVSGLKIGGSIHVREVTPPAGVKILTDPEVSVFSVKHPTEEVVPEAPAEGEVAEPEVIREKKAEEGAPAETAPAKEAAKPAAAPAKEKEAKTG
ncbi:MAG: 50S ribosomal protein L25 [Candidatus Omnitrophica bacterium]|nr:50S ribosomal protein L25 [Candidatus Omnitrophota bacterium]